MTQNQIAFWNMQYTRQQNERMWKETQTHNRNVEQETNRANLAREAQARDELTESRRSHLANESLGVNSLNETKRHQLAVETEQGRANRANEAIKMQSNSNQLLDTIYRNSNAATTNSINRQSNQIKQMEAQNASRNVSESIRSHMANERLQSSYQSESARSNRAQEALSASRNSLTSLQLLNDRKNTELARDRSLQQMQYNYEALNETRRANEAREFIQGLGVASNAIGSFLKFGLLRRMS